MSYSIDMRQDTTITIRTRESLKTRIETIAKKRDISMSEATRILLENGLLAEEKRIKKHAALKGGWK